ncbi:MAG: leucine efflux protein LeuE [Pseudomonadota bacterium]
MLGITDFPAFLLITTITVLLPGPNSLFVLSVAARQGVRDGYRAALGVFVGDGLLMIAAAAGLAPLLAAYPQVFTVLKLAGACYLAWMGVGLLRAGLQQWQQRHLAMPEVGAQKEGWVAKPFQRTLGISLLNPKAIFFFMAFFIQFVSADAPHPVLSFAVLGIVLTAISAAYLSLLIFTGSRLAASFRERRRLAAGATGSAGLLFIGFGAKLASATT